MGLMLSSFAHVIYMNKQIVYVLSTLSQLADDVQVRRMEGNNSATVIYLSCSYHSVL